MNQYTKSNLKLPNGAEFEIVHNFNRHGLSIEDALPEWAKKAKEHTADDFCAWVSGKDITGLVALPYEKYLVLTKDFKGSLLDPAKFRNKIILTKAMIDRPL